MRFKIDKSENVFEEIYESGTSRLYKHLTDDSECAIVSPYRAPEIGFEVNDEESRKRKKQIEDAAERENRKKLSELKLWCKNNGYGYTEFISRWVENNEESDERSLLIYRISKDEAIMLGKRYNQSSVIIKDKDSCVEICTTPFEDYSEGDVVHRFNNVGKGVLNVQDATEIFSKRAGGPSSMPVKGNRPFALKPVSEVYEVTQPRPSYFRGYSEYRIF